jgi:hypothetical protein
MDLTHAVNLLCVEEDPLSDGRLSGIDVSHEPDISGSHQSFLSSHLLLLMFSFFLLPKP